MAVLGLSLAISGAAAAGPRADRTPPVPGIDPGFIYHQLALMATHFGHRESGYAAGAAGHTGFARYWAAEMVKLLGPFGATVRRYPFKIAGWIGRPSTAPAVNVEITVPGVTDPARVVVIGCHYDGEAISTQSAIASIGPVAPGQLVTLTASGFVPGARAASLRYSWAFGDGGTALGPAVQHAYAGPGRYVAALTVSAPHRPPRIVAETISAGQPATYQNPFTATPGIVPKTTLEGRPTSNRSVVLPTGRPGLSDKVRRVPIIIGRAPEPRRAASAGSVRASSPAGWILAGIAIVVAAALLFLALRRRAGRRVTRNRSAA